jgi:cytidine deaminase
MTSEERQQLIDAAREARENAVAPFSKFKVGAALRTRAGRIFHGCNVENCSYGLTVCAERVALLSALAAGEREFTAVAVMTQSEEPSTPCGPCRQLMWEYCGDIEIVLANLAGRTKSFSLAALFPEPFYFSLED